MIIFFYFIRHASKQAKKQRNTMNTTTHGLRMTYGEVLNRASSVRVHDIKITSISPFVMKKGEITAFRLRNDTEKKQSIIFVPGGEYRHRARFPLKPEKLFFPTSPPGGFSLYIGITNETHPWSSVDSLKLVVTFTCEDKQGKQSTHSLTEIIDCPIQSSNKISTTSTNATTTTNANEDPITKFVWPSFPIAHASTMASEKVATMFSTANASTKTSEKVASETKEKETEINKKRALAAHVLASFSDSERETDDEQELNPNKRSVHEDPISLLPVLEKRSALPKAEAKPKGLGLAKAQELHPLFEVADREELFLDDLVQQGRLSASVAADPSSSVPAFEEIPCNRNLLLSGLKNRESINALEEEIKALQAQIVESKSKLVAQLEERKAILSTIKRVRAVWQDLNAAYKAV